MSLDFRRGAELFMATPRELAMALGIRAEDVDRYRKRPHEAPHDVLTKLAEVLIERGRGMARVGEMLREQTSD